MPFTLPLLISIHTLRMEGDWFVILTNKIWVGFQSTPSAWRVTYLATYPQVYDGISIHTLRMEGDVNEI